MKHDFSEARIAKELNAAAGARDVDMSALPSGAVEKCCRRCRDDLGMDAPAKGRGV